MPKHFLPATFVKEVEIKSANGKFKVIKVGMHLEEFYEFAKQHVNEKGFVNWDITAKKAPKSFATHDASVWVREDGDNVKQDNKQLQQHLNNSRVASQSEISLDEIPF